MRQIQGRGPSTHCQSVARTDPERLTVLGVEPTDGRLATELWRFVPAEADAVYAPSFAAPSLAALARTALRNPPVALYLGFALALHRVRRDGPLPAAEAVEAAAQRRNAEFVRLDAEPLDRVREQGPQWTLAAWIVVAVAVLALGLLAIAFGAGDALSLGSVGDALGPIADAFGPIADALDLGSGDEVPLGLREQVLAVGIAAISPPLTVGFVLAHAGAHVERQDERIATAVLEAAERDGHAHPAVVVPVRHLPGVAERAKDRGVPANERDVGAQLAVEPTTAGAPSRR